MTDDREYTPHQRRIIRDYYDTSKQRSVAKVQEIVTELCLATTDRKRDRLWERARKALEALGMKPSMIDHICSKRSPEILAGHVKDLLSR